MSSGVGFLVALLAIASVADGSPHGEVTFREGLPAGPQREGLGSGRRGPAFEKIQSAILVPPSDCGLTPRHVFRPRSPRPSRAIRSAGVTVAAGARARRLDAVEPVRNSFVAAMLGDQPVDPVLAEPMA